MVKDNLWNVVWKFWPLYCKFKNMRHGRGGWTDCYGYREVMYYDMETGYGNWEWIGQEEESSWEVV